jgi:hypothetical protein
VDTSAGIAGLALDDQGNVGGEDLGASTHTFYPAVMVDAAHNLAVGFSASSAATYCGAYYATRLAGDPPGTVGSSGVVRAGVAPYKRFHNGNRNRWGDCSGIALDPATEAVFHVFNAYAGPVGTPGAGFNGPENGRWCTALARFVLDATTPVEGARPPIAALAQNAPNPFNPSTRITFTLAQRTRAAVVVYDTAGRRIRTLVDDVRAPGAHDVSWDGRDASGRVVASGVYYCRLVAGDVDETRKMVLLK